LGEMAVDLPAFVLGVHVSDDLFFFLKGGVPPFRV